MPEHPIEVIASRYEFVRELGRGGMGRVIAARDRTLGREVAIKLVHERLLDPTVEARFEREARAASSLNHPNILTVFDIGKDNGRPYLVSELLEGQTLQERFERGPMDERTAAGIALQLARGLGAAHGRGIVHRDLKPANAFVTSQGVVKLLDFGIAKLLDTERAIDGPDSLTESGRSMGTVGYMAPEQVRGQAVTERTDIFSLGVILHELLRGERLYKRGSSVESGYAIISEEPPLLSAAVNPALAQLISSCLRKKPEERPGAAEVIAKLEALGGLTQGAPLTPRSNLTPTSKLPIPWSRAQRSSIAGALLLVPVLALLLWLRPWHERVMPGPVAAPVAVFPFDAAGDAEQAYLGEGAVDLIGGALGNLGVRTVEPRRLLRELQQAASPLDVARRIGAGAYVVGRIKRAGTSLQLEAELHDANDGSLHRVAHVDGDPAKPLEAINQITAQLAAGLRAIDSAAITPSRFAAAASVSTHSAAALAEWLKGEALLRRGDQTGATDAFRRATGADPEFALAQYRLAVTAAFRQPGLSADALERALVLRQSLSPRDRALVEAFADFSQGRAARAEEEYRAIISANPDDAEAQLQLAEVLFHWNPLRGRRASEAEPILDRVLVLDPDNGAALTHLVDLAQMSGQKPLVRALASRALALDRAGDPTPRLPIEWAEDWASGDAEGRAQVLAGLRENTAQVSDTFALGVWEDDDLSGARAVAKVLTDDAQGVRRSYGNFFRAITELARGQPDAALASFAQAEALAPDPRMTHYALRAAAFPIATSSDGFRAARARCRAWNVSTDPFFTPWRAHTAGMLALRAGDPDAARAEVATMRALPNTSDSIAGDLALELQAEIAAAEGHDDEALAHLDAMELRIPYRALGLFSYVAPTHLRARILARQGHDAEALELLRITDFNGYLAAASFAPDALLEGQLLEHSGHPREAAAQLRRFAALWSDAEPALRPQVADALARAHRLDEAVATSAQPAPK